MILPGIDDAAAEDEDDEPELCYQLGPVPTDGDAVAHRHDRLGPRGPDQPGRVGRRPQHQGRRPRRSSTRSPASASTATRPARPGSWRSCSTARCSRPRRSSEPTFDDVGPADLRQLHPGAGQGPGPGAAVRRPAGRARGPDRADGVGHARRGLAARPGSSPGSSASPSWSLYMLLYYRALGRGGAARASASGRRSTSRSSRWLGETQGLALALAGVTGIVVSVGVTVDSYVVYFERLKDEIRSGKTIRSSVDRGLPAGVPHDPRRRHLELHRRRPALLPHRRPGARLRLLPRPLDAARRRRRLLLHPAARGAPRPQPLLHRPPDLRRRPWPRRAGSQGTVAGGRSTDGASARRLYNGETTHRLRRPEEALVRRLRRW